MGDERPPAIDPSQNEILEQFKRGAGRLWNGLNGRGDLPTPWNNPANNDPATGKPKEPLFQPKSESASAAPNLLEGLVPEHPGFSGDTTGLDLSVQDSEGRIHGNDFLRNAGGGGARSDLAVVPEGEEFAKVGGKRGKEWFEEGLVNGPERLGEAVKASGKAQTERAEELAGAYKSEAERSATAAAAMQVRQARDEQAVQQRQKNLELATDKYTQDLQDQGKFWTNPGNIIAAIAYSLMPMLGGDPTSGVKLINEAINRDMANRKQAADTELGALRSNLDGYRKIAGDNQAGDLLAESKAKEVAANQVQAIAAKYESPISKARAEASYQALMNDSIRLRMQVYQAGGIREAAHYEHGPLIRGRSQGFDGAYEPLGGGPFDPRAKQSVGAATQGSLPGGTPTVANTTGKTLDAKGAALLSFPKEAQKLVSRGQSLPGGMGSWEYAQASIARQAAAKFPDNPQAAQEFRRTLTKEAEQGVKDIAAAMDAGGYYKQMSGLVRVQRQMAAIEATEPNPEKFFNSTLRAAAPEFNDWYQNKMRIVSDPSTSTDEAKRQKESADAAMRLRVSIGKMQQGYYKENAGSALSPAEERILSQAIHSGSSWAQVKEFARTEAEDTRNAALNKMNMAGNEYAPLLYLAGGAGRVFGYQGMPKGNPEAGRNLIKPGTINPSRGDKQ